MKDLGNEWMRMFDTKAPKVAPASPLSVSPRNIGSFRCSKPSYIVDDLARLTGANQHVVAKVLMARGVGRLFTMRRRLLQIRAELRKLMRVSYEGIAEGNIRRPYTKAVPNVVKDYYRHLGRQEALREFATRIDELVNLHGFELPDNDQKFEQLLRVKASSLRKV